MSIQGGQHWLHREDVADVSVVRVLAERLQGEGLCRDIFGLLCALVEEAGRHRLVLDLSRVAAMDSHAVGRLVMLNRKTSAAGGRLVLCGLAAAVAEGFERMRLGKVFDVFPTAAEALASFPPTPPLDAASQGG